MGKVGCVAIVKNEARHIAEWLAWQFCIGFDTVFLFDNGSTDGTREIAAGFAPARDVQLFDYPVRAPDYQRRAYQSAIGLAGPGYDWLAFFDTDEFLVLEEGRELKPLLAARPEAAIGVSWAMFGSSGHDEMPAGLVTASFLRRSRPDFFPNRHIKTILRPNLMIRCLNPHAFEVDGDYVDLLGRRLDFAQPGLLAADPDYAGGKLHHYFTRSRAHWREKMARGYHDLERDPKEFETYDRNEIADDSAARLAARFGLAAAAAPSPKPAPNPTPGPAADRAAGAPAKPAPGPAAPARCAVVLVVKDEAHDILDWLAWHRILGFDAAIVFDDDSTDGTWEKLQQAARVQDVRLRRTPGPRDGRYQERQWEAYRLALTEYAQEFTWLAFFDADEYLSLLQDETVQDFLRRFPDADHVLVNWCHYGSSGHYLKPDQPAPLAYTWHGKPSEPIGRHVKAIVRPNKVGPRRVNVHCFDVPAARSCLANGKMPVWDGTPGIIDADPDWSVAKLMHFQCRSMEHFVDRLKKRPQFQNRPGLWEGYDVNQMEDARPRARAAALHAELARLTAAPSPPAAPAPPPSGPKYDYAIAVCARWETPYIAEWLDYYRALGFAHVFLYCNDDDPEALRAQVRPYMQSEAPFVTFRHHAAQGEQYEMYRHFVETSAAEAEWVGFFDVDEFLRLPAGETIASFMGRFDPGIDCVLFNWVCFGPNGHKTPPGGSVLENFTRREAKLHPFTKYVTRSEKLRRVDLADRQKMHGFWHHPHATEENPIRTVNVLGEDMAAYYKDFPAAATAFVAEPARRAGLLATAVVHHYLFRSEQAFWDRSRRGLKGDFSGQTLWRDLAEGPGFQGFLNGMNAVPDESLAGFWRARGVSWSAPPAIPAPAAEFPVAGANAVGVAATATEAPGVETVPDLIFALGATPGEIEAWLADGLRVVDVEPDVQLYYELTERFAEAIEARRLHVHNLAPGARYGDIVEFTHQLPPGASAPEQKSYHVMTIDWRTLVQKHGAPRFLKIESEDGALAFLGGAGGAEPLPSYCAVACRGPEAARALFGLGYRYFKLTEPVRAGENSSAPAAFGVELPGEWVEFSTFEAEWQARSGRGDAARFDCHAWMP